MIYLGIDSGTQSTKTVALDVDTGSVIATAQAAYGLIEGLPAGHLEQHPKDWIAAVQKTVVECLTKLGDRKNEVRGIGVSGQQHGLVTLDEHDQPVRPAKLWCDTSTIAECADFSDQFGGVGGLIELAGNPVLPGYTAPKILWLKRHEPGNFAKTRSILLPHDYINFWLTGTKTMEFGDASGTALLDVRTRKWCGPLCDFIDSKVQSLLPPLQSSRKSVGTLRDVLRREWGLASSPVVSAGGGDNMMGAIGTGNIVPGVVTASLGTSGTIYATSDQPIIDPRGEVAAFCDSADHWLPLVCTMNVTVVTEQVRNLLGLSIAAFNSAAAEAPAGSGGLIFLPYLTGERTPNLPQATGTLHGLTTQNMTSSHLARAAIEGATFGLAYGLNRMRDLGIRPTEIRLTGGGSKSAVWRTIAANIFGCETVCLEASEGAALGGAIQAAAADSHALQEIVTRCVRLDESTRASVTGDSKDVYAELSGRFDKLSKSIYGSPDDRQRGASAK